MMLDLDIKRFWEDDALAHEENCFSKKAPQVALGIRMSNECVFAELGEEGSPWGYTDPVRRRDLNCRYNEKAREIVGISLLSEELPPPADARFPEIRQIGEVFGGRYEFDGNTTWLRENPELTDERALEAMLDRVEQMDLRAFILPPNWEAEKTRIFETYGIRPKPFTSVRGPVTLADSIYGVEKMTFLYYDAPELYERFSKVIGDVTLGYIDICAEEAGYTRQTMPHMFHFNDDDCCLLTPDMYEVFGYPILQRVFAVTSPNPEDIRYQHSDSAMAHLLPILGRLNLTGCNFGPTVTVREIRKYMKHTRIDGQLAPFTFMRNNEADIIAEVRRDCDMAREGDLRGLNISTAGSINNGSLLTSMRTVMAAIQNYGRY